RERRAANGTGVWAWVVARSFSLKHANSVVPAKAGIHFDFGRRSKWVPAFAGTTELGDSAVPRGAHRLGVMIGQLFLVLLHLLVDFVDERVDRRVHVRRGRVRVQRAGGFLAGELDRRFGLMQNLFDTQHDAELMQIFEVARDPLELVRAVIAERGSDFDRMTLNRDLHDGLLFWRTSGGAGRVMRGRRPVDANRRRR